MGCMPDARATKPALLVHQLGYTAARRRALLRLIGFSAADHAHAAYLHRQVLVADVDRIVDDFYGRLSANAAVRAASSGAGSRSRTCATRSATIC